MVSQPFQPEMPTRSFPCDRATPFHLMNLLDEVSSSSAASSSETTSVTSPATTLTSPEIPVSNVSRSWTYNTFHESLLPIRLSPSPRVSPFLLNDHTKLSFPEVSCNHVSAVSIADGPTHSILIHNIPLSDSFAASLPLQINVVETTPLAGEETGVVYRDLDGLVNTFDGPFLAARDMQVLAGEVSRSANANMSVWSRKTPVISLLRDMGSDIEGLYSTNPGMTSTLMSESLNVLYHLSSMIGIPHYQLDNEVSNATLPSLSTTFPNLPQHTPIPPLLSAQLHHVRARLMTMHLRNVDHLFTTITSVNEPLCGDYPVLFGTILSFIWIFGKLLDEAAYLSTQHPSGDSPLDEIISLHSRLDRTMSNLLGRFKRWQIRARVHYALPGVPWSWDSAGTHPNIFILKTLIQTASSGYNQGKVGGKVALKWAEALVSDDISSYFPGKPLSTEQAQEVVDDWLFRYKEIERTVYVAAGGSLEEDAFGI